MDASPLSRWDARDRALFARLVIAAGAGRPARLFWTALTHLGGTACVTVVALLLLALPALRWTVGVEVALTLLLSHCGVQMVKRSVNRPRPSRALAHHALCAEPDRFSFPSGHAAAAMSVAFVVALRFPAVAPALLPLAALVGLSRVVLGVHYPGDVLAGQAIAMAVAAMLRWA